MMKISTNPPPNNIAERAIKAFGLTDVKFEDGLMFTYGDTIHSVRNVDPDFIVHESEHSKRQLAYEGGPEAWWEKYFTDKEFVLQEELAAYRAQYKFVCIKVKDRNKRNLLLMDYAGALSGKLYGNIIEGMAAMQAIKK